MVFDVAKAALCRASSDKAKEYDPACHLNVMNPSMATKNSTSRKTFRLFVPAADIL